ncbi:zinc ribbon domain-containing protein [Salinilacihabitans rarus]|uniref:zinc ribbon domain-containing protein n=1 Tax=Salinilacihabitans rarus TaxID=2961596 RepID=UPI0020C8C1EC|nr:zinc ribbon domain-containing protein [Salinilacihabitans rarus]
MRWIRALAAGGLSVLVPGAGHALLRDWVRALLFAGLYVSAVAVFLPTEGIAAADSMAAAMDVVSEETTSIDRFALSFLVLFAAIDASFRALELTPGTRRSTDGPTCPNCGREVDEELDFCHWCTTRLEPVEEETIG